MNTRRLWVANSRLLPESDNLDIDGRRRQPSLTLRFYEGPVPSELLIIA